LREIKKGDLIVFAPDLKVASCVITDGTFFRRFSTFENMAAISAFPFDRRIFLENLALLDVC
jgi:ASC-1-like (ASCH) protein